MEYINNKEFEFVNNLILSKDNVSEQLRLLKKYKDREDVKNYIKKLKKENKSEYVNYLIERYYEGNNDLQAPKKNCVEETFKVLLRPVQIRKKRDIPVETDIKVGDTVIVYPQHLDGRKTKESDKAIVEKIDKYYGIATIKQNLFGSVASYDIDIENITKQ